MDVIGKEIGNYRILTEINSGAYGSVYKAERVHLKGRIVVIKLLHTYLGSSKERDQFAQEAQFLTTFSHPHILSLIDFCFVVSVSHAQMKCAHEQSYKQLTMRTSSS